MSTVEKKGPIISGLLGQRKLAIDVAVRVRIELARIGTLRLLSSWNRRTDVAKPKKAKRDDIPQ